MIDNQSKQEAQDATLRDLAAETKSLGQKVDDQVNIDTDIKDSKRVATHGIRLVYIAFAIIITVLGLLAYWGLQDAQPLTFKKYPIPLNNQPVRAGGYATLLYDYCKNVPSSGKIETSVVSKLTILTSPDAIDESKKGCKSIEAPTPIPPQAATGPYHIHYKATYRINPIKEVTQEWDSVEFEVLERDK